MITKWRVAIVGGGVGLYLVGLGVLGEMILNQHDKAMRQRRTYLMRLDQQAPAGLETSGALQSAHSVDLAWHDAYVEALGSGRQAGPPEVGDASLGIGQVPGGSKASRRPDVAP